MQKLQELSRKSVIAVRTHAQFTAELRMFPKNHSLEFHKIWQRDNSAWVIKKYL